MVALRKVRSLAVCWLVGSTAVPVGLQKMLPMISHSPLMRVPTKKIQPLIRVPELIR